MFKLIQGPRHVIEQMFNALPHLMWTANPDGYLDYFNKNWYDYTGVPPGTVGPEGWSPPVHPDDLTELGERWYENVNNGSLEWVMEIRLREASTGEYRWFLSRATALKDEGGRILKWFGTCIDIHYQKMATANAVEYANHLSQVLSALPLFVAIADKEGRLLELDQKALAATGCTWEQVRGAKFWQCPWWENLEEIQARVHLAFQSAPIADNNSIRFDTHYRNKEGALMPIEFGINALCSPTTGEVTHFVLTGIDIAHRKQLEASQKLINLQYQEYLSLQGELVEILQNLSSELDINKLLQSIVDSATRITRASYGAFFYNNTGEDGQQYLLYTLSGARQEDFATFPPVRNTAIFAPTFVEKQVVRIDNVHRDGRFGKNTPYHGMPAGHLPVVSYLAVPVLTANGGVLGAMLFAHSEAGRFTQTHEDMVRAIAAQAAIALEKARLYQEAQEAIAVREDFLSVAAHEIRTPLAPLALQLQFLRRLITPATAPDPAYTNVANSLRLADKQITRLTKLVEQLLDASRVRLGRFDLDRTQVDLMSLVLDTASVYEDRCKQVGCHLDIRVDNSNVVGNWDASRLQQVVVNLLSNAIQYAPNSRISIEIGRRDDFAVLRFVDNGPGIAVEDHARIFNRFERSDLMLKRGGLGLGLYICKEIVQAHGGKIHVRSELGNGSCFTVELPL